MALRVQTNLHLIISNMDRINIITRRVKDVEEEEVINDMEVVEVAKPIIIKDNSIKTINTINNIMLGKPSIRDLYQINLPF